MRVIQFNNEYLPQNQIELESVGNACIEAINEEGYLYYLLIKTTLGTTSMFEYGPVDSDSIKLQSNYSVYFQRINFDEKKITNYINKWLNDRKKKIVEASVIDEYKFLDNYKDICYTVSNYGKEIY